VMLAEEVQTRQLYAVKVLKKDYIVEHDEVEALRSEKRVFLIANRERHPFLVNLHSCFQTESRVYFVMEYVSGGDLMWHIQREAFSEKRAKFYACEALLALEYFHKNDILYRDLKLDNILLTLDGHIKIADYGLCKENIGFGGTASTFCGTPEFMAPEAPFAGDSEDKIFNSILHTEPVFPAGTPKDAADVIQKLLIKDANRRLGAGPTDSAEIKQHRYFASVDFDAVLEMRVPPPFRPTV
ncbi:Serine/threonine kinase, partial [Cladochytrium tenue]